MIDEIKFPKPRTHDQFAAYLEIALLMVENFSEEVNKHAEALKSKSCHKDKAIEGWYCTRTKGHTGPCAVHKE